MSLEKEIKNLNGEIKKFYYFIAFVVLALSVLTATIFLAIDFKDTNRKIHNLIFQRMLGEVKSITDNYKQHILEFLPKDSNNWYEYLKTHPKIRIHLQKDMELLSTKNIKYIYFLGVKNGRLVFFADGSKEDKAEFGEVFEPIQAKEYEKLKPHFFLHKKVRGLYLTYINPIVIDGKLKGMIVADVPVRFLHFVKFLINNLSKPVNWILAFSFILVALLFSFAYFDYKRERELVQKTKELAQANEKLEKLNNELKKMNEELEEKVKEKVQEIRNKDVIILNQSKLAALGEMLNMIAHQWRQPLNSLSAFAITIQMKYEFGELEDKECLEFAKFVEAQTQKMSEIIDDFMNFAKPNEEKEEFNLKDVIEEVIKIVEVQLKNHNIKVEIDLSTDEKIKSYKKELSHVLLNLISNARDALDNIEKDDKWIKIYTQNDGNYIKIIVEDNGGGIAKEIKDRIFEPYFTTKDKSKGTGLGLYMSKKIVEERLGGVLEFENTKDGAKFVIKLKKENE